MGPAGLHVRADRYCAFADPSCSTNARYDDSAGMDLALSIAVGALDLPVGFDPPPIVTDRRNAWLFPGAA